MTERRDRIHTSSLATGSLVGGFLLLLVSVPLVVLLVPALPLHEMSQWLIVPLPSVSQPIDIFPPLEAGAFDATTWLWGLLGDFLGIAVTVIYYLNLGLTIVGVGLVIAGVTVLSEPRAIVKGFRRSLAMRRVQALLGLYAIGGAVLVSPALVRAALELTLTIALWLGILWVVVSVGKYFEATESGVVRIGLWYPLTVASVVLPIVIVGLISPTGSPWFRSETAQLIGPLFESGVGVSDPAIGLGNRGVPIALTYSGFWFSAVFGFGWVVGVVSEGLLWLVPRIASAVAVIGSRVDRLGK